MSLGVKCRSAKDYQPSMKEESREGDEGVLNLPHGHGLWSSRLQGWMARGSGPMTLASLLLDLVQWPSFWPFRHI